jgi:hypothetical protein
MALENPDISDFLISSPSPRMKLAHELFQDMKPETALSVFQYLRDEQREVYKATINSLAANRKFRPVIIQRKPVTEQIDWILKNVKLRGSGEVAAQVLQLKGHTGLLKGFLDGLGIEHDGEGAAEDIPDELDAKKLKSTITGLLKDHDPEIVKIYLHIFQLQRSGGWSEITSLIEVTPALQFGVAAEPVAEKPAKPAKKAAKAEEAPAEAAPEAVEAEEA